MNVDERMKRFSETFAASALGDGELLAAIGSTGQFVRMESGARIYADGDTCTGIGFLISGLIRVYKIGATGREITLYEVFPGETCILNVACLAANQNYPAHATMVEAGEVLMLPAHAFQGLMATQAEMRSFVFSILNRRFAEIIELVEAVAFGRLDERLLNYLEEKSEDGTLRASHQEIANALGSSREVISRVLKDFERKELVRIGRTRIDLIGQPSH